MEITPGIYQIRLPIPVLPSGEKPRGVLSSVNVYLIEGETGWVMVDMGLDVSSFLDIIDDELRRIGISFKSISKLVITHAHIDHIGLAEKMKRLSSAAVYLHRLETSFMLSDGFHANEIIETMTKWLRKNGYPEKEIRSIQSLPSEKATYLSPGFPDAFAYKTKAVFPDIILEGDEHIKVGRFNFQVLWTPGHSPGHICLYEPTKKLLLSGDHILPYITPVMMLNPYSRPNPLGDYIQSLGRIRALDISLILPGHGDGNFDCGQRISELLYHHHKRLEEILEVIRKTSKTAYEISSEITWMHEEKKIPWARLDPWSRRLAFMETLAHLKVLEENAQVIQKSSHDLVRYCRTSRPQKGCGIRLSILDSSKQIGKSPQFDLKTK